MNRQKVLVLSLVLFAAVSFALGQTAPKAAAPRVTPIAFAAGAGGLAPNLAVRGEQMYLSWIAPAGEGYALRFATRAAKGAWTAPRTIVQGDDWFVSPADYPSIFALPDGTLAANWMVNIDPIIEAYSTNIALSKDGGRTWSKPIVPHRDGTENQHGFLSMAPAPGGGFEAVWLDGRKMEESLEMSLMGTSISADGKLGPEVTVDGRVCDCCQTSAVATPDGMVVAYRDRTEKEIRDISTVRFSNGRWLPPQPLSNDGWEIDGCPINGPSIKAAGSTLAVAWFTGANESYRVKMSFSVDGGTKFGTPIRIDEGAPVGRVDVLVLGPNEALVSWIERAAKGAQLRARTVKTDGTLGPSMVVAEVSPTLSSGFPRIEKVGNEVVFAWTESGKTSRVRTASLALK